jgi:4-hydroxy-tetrahydrodipicolinate reductase
MKIAFIGYGKMGKAIETLALEKGYTITARIDENNQSEANTFTADVAIEFTNPESAHKNVISCLKRGIPVVCGTTGWLQHLPEVEKLCLDNNGTFFYASNYSIGVNLFFQLNEKLAALLKPFPQYAASMEEIHHIHKKDAPSGTAITLAEGILRYNNRFTQYQLGQSTDSQIISIEAKREGEVPGTHVVKYKSEVDEITIRHEAYSRQGFASGALAIAEWIVAKHKKGMLSMADYLKL